MWGFWCVVSIYGGFIGVYEFSLDIVCFGGAGRSSPGGRGPGSVGVIMVWAIVIWVVWFVGVIVWHGDKLTGF